MPEQELNQPRHVQLRARDNGKNWLIGVAAVVAVGAVLMGFTSSGRTAPTADKPVSLTLPAPKVTVVEPVPENRTVVQPARQKASYTSGERNNVVVVEGNNNTTVIGNVTHNHVTQTVIVQSATGETKPETPAPTVSVTQKRTVSKPVEDPACKDKREEHERTVAAWKATLGAK
jgi:hypothetical protein